MKKLILILSFMLYGSCRTIIDYRYPVENFVKNSLKGDIIFKSYKNGKLKDSVSLKTSQEFLFLEDRDGDGDGQSQVFQLDSITIKFFDGKTKTDIYCPMLFAKKDTLAGTKCTSDVVNFFHSTRTTEIHDEKTRLTKFVYAVDTIDYREAR
jgi:hypothetical protein